jgi:POT family proton-dependent oligopeptide transporter
MSAETPNSPTAASASRDTRFFGQPWALAHLFGVEMWERFSFYGMQSILAFYLIFSVAEGGLGIDKGVAGGIVGAYGSLVYLSTILGAWLADRILGNERVLFYSAIVIMVGHICLAVLPGFPGLAAGLVAIAVGSGGLKANATTIVGALYAAGDTRRDAGFSLFYLGINLGALIGPLLTGFLQTSLGFHYGFGAAAVGMFLGLLQYSLGRRHLPAVASRVANPLPPEHRGRVLAVGVGILIVVGVGVLTHVVTVDTVDNVVLVVVALASAGYFRLLLTSPLVTADERRRVLAFIPLYLASAAFWSLYQQQFTVLPIYTVDRIDLGLFGWTMPPAWVQSINPVFIIILSGVFAAIWTSMRDRQPSTALKFALSNIVMGVAFLLFLPFANGGRDSVPLLAITGILFVFTIAELLLSPVGLAAATRLAPRAFTSQMVALFFLSVALGTAFSGVLSNYYDPENEVPYFGILGLVSIVLGLLLALGSGRITRLIAPVEASKAPAH